MPPPAAIASFGLVGPTYSTRNRLWTSERAINWYVSIDESKHAQSPMELSPTPGLATFTSTTDPPVRGLWAGDHRLFAVGGSRLHEVYASSSMDFRGFVGSGGTPVQFAASGYELLLADGDRIYRDGGGAATGTNTSVVLEPAISVVWLDQYYVALEKDSNRLRCSLCDGGITWPTLDFIDVTGTTADRAVRLEVHEGHIWVFCRKSIVPYF